MKTLDRIAVHLGTWALRRLYGADCPTNVYDDFPGMNTKCLSCDAKKLIDEMRALLYE